MIHKNRFKRLKSAFLVEGFKKLHVFLFPQMFIENSKHIGLLTEDLMSQLDDDSDGSRARRKKRRSGSLNRKAQVLVH